MRRAVRWWDGHQVALYLAAIVVGGVVGVSIPSAAPTLEAATTPTLALLLFATFLGVPLVSLGRAFRDRRFLGTVVVVNFGVVPVVAFGLSRIVADDAGLLAGLLLVLLTPCIDYVVAFTGLAGGARAKLLAATPLLMLLQVLLLPVYLLLFAGDLAAQVDPDPFVDAFLTLILIPLAAAAVVQSTARRHPLGRGIETVASGAMVPLMMATLAVIVGSQIAAVGGEALTLVRLLPAYAAFPAIMLLVGWAAGRMARLDVPGRRAVVFSGVTRNSLVVLPLALALPAPFAIAPLAVVTQTLVELVALVVLVKVVPLIVRDTAPEPA